MNSTHKINWPNLVTFSRIILAFFTFGLLLSNKLNHTGIYICFALTIIVVVCDFLDGKLARILNQASIFGAWFDIAGDRLVEMGYWLVFSSLHLISPWIALIFLARGIFVDGIRAFALQEGYTAFGETSMMKTELGKFLVSSRFSRGAYGASKIIAFALVILSMAHPELSFIANIFVYIATFFCLVRGLPVLFEGREFINR